MESLVPPECSVQFVPGSHWFGYLMSSSKMHNYQTQRRRAGLLHSARLTISSIVERLRSGKILRQIHRVKNHKSYIPYPWLLGVPSVFLVLGYSMNAIVMGMNGGQMPVQWPGGCSGLPVDGVHVCMTAQTHLKFLADWIVQYEGVASPGDFFLWGYYGTRWFAATAWITLVINDCVRAFHAAKIGRRKTGRR